VIIRDKDSALRLTFTNEIGRYRFVGLSQGKYDFFAFMPGFINLNSSLDLTASVNRDEVLRLVPVETCACVMADPDPTIPERLRSAMSQLRKISLRTEDLQTGAALDEQRRELLNDFRWLNINAVSDLKDALRETDTQVRINAVVILLDLSSGSSERKPVDISAVSVFLARAAADSNSTLSQYARLTLENFLK
jgi:hypothetical protein